MKEHRRGRVRTGVLAEGISDAERASGMPALPKGQAADGGGGQEKQRGRFRNEGPVDRDIVNARPFGPVSGFVPGSVVEQQAQIDGAGETGEGCVEGVGEKLAWSGSSSGSDDFGAVGDPAGSGVDLEGDGVGDEIRVIDRICVKGEGLDGDGFTGTGSEVEGEIAVGADCRFQTGGEGGGGTG